MKVQWIIGMMIFGICLLGVLQLLQQSITEGFYATSSNKPDLQSDLTKMIQSVTKIGKKMLNPEMWSERIQMMHLTPVELARKQLSVKG
jgi:hypothetical protein